MNVILSYVYKVENELVLDFLLGDKISTGVGNINTIGHTNSPVEIIKADTPSYWSLYGIPTTNTVNDFIRIHVSPYCFRIFQKHGVYTSPYCRAFFPVMYAL